LQSAKIAQESGVATVAEHSEIRQVEFGKQGITGSQAGIMCAEARFEKLAAPRNFFEPLVSRLALAVISSQIAKCLFTLKDRCGPNLPGRQPIRGDIGAISTLGKTHFHSARGIPLTLCPY
jgi:hypothetical protein